MQFPASQIKKNIWHILTFYLLSALKEPKIVCSGAEERNMGQSEISFILRSPMLMVALQPNKLHCLHVFLGADGTLMDQL